MTNIKDHVLIDTITEIVEESDEGGGSLPFGESNTASNIGTEGEGLFDHKEGVDLQFKNIEAGDNVILTPDEVKHTVKIDSIYIGATPPSKLTMIWYNTICNLLFYYDSVRVKWLSIQTTSFIFGQDVANGNALRSVGIDFPGPNTGIYIPVDMAIVSIWAQAAAGQIDKKFYLRKDSIGGTIINEFDLVNYKYTNDDLNADIAAGSSIWAYASSIDSPSLDIGIIYLAKRICVS